MGLKTSGETMQSLNNSSRRCAHASAIFSPPGFALPMVGAGREAIVFTACYVMQWGEKAEHTVGLLRCRRWLTSTQPRGRGRALGSVHAKPEYPLALQPPEPLSQGVEAIQQTWYKGDT